MSSLSYCQVWNLSSGQIEFTTTTTSKMINIGGDANDVNYRYKMPPLTTKIEGRAGGIKTVLMNIADVAKHLHTKPAYATKFFGMELGSLSEYDNKRNVGIVHGVHQTKELQNKLNTFIREFILCPRCKLPELQFKVHQKKPGLLQKCASCGWKGANRSNHKVKTYIINHPPKSKKDKGSKSQKRKTRKKKRDTYSTPFNRIKSMQHRTKHIVFGFIRRYCMDYIIPPIIQHICLLYFCASFESLILTDDEQNIFLSLLDKNDKFSDLGSYLSRLIYRGSRDGFRRNNFVQKCHNVSNILIIIQTTQNDVFGGYTAIGWHDNVNNDDSDDNDQPPWVNFQRHYHYGKNTYIKDEKAFLFLLRSSQDKKPQIGNIKNYRAHEAIDVNDGSYCIFGAGRDIVLSDICNKADTSYTEQATYDLNILTSRSTYTMFTVQQIEAFLLQ